MATLFSMNDKVQAALEKLFQQHRLVFWYDDKAEMTGLFESLEIPGVEKLVIENNEFALKYRLLIEQPAQPFLVYQSKTKPPGNENWLLDLLLSNYEFRTEASSLYLQDLELPPEFKNLVQQHEEFFASEKRLGELKALKEPGDREHTIRLKMLSVICTVEPEWEKVLYALFAEALRNKQEKYKAVEKFGLGSFFWETVEKKYSYQSPTPAIKDCLLQLVQNNFERSIPSGQPMLNKEASLLVNRWKENTKAKHVFYDWSLQLEKELGIESRLPSMNAKDLSDADTFSVIDKKIIHDIKEHVANNMLANHVIQERIEKRKVKFFFADYARTYLALSHGSALLDEIRKSNLTVQSPKDGFDKYKKEWYKIDRLYRKYILASGQAEHQAVLKELTLHIEKAYGNSFLLTLGNNWQSVLDGMPVWNIEKITGQKQFYQQWVVPYIKKENRVFVIVSGALRYESATELREIILQEDKYTATLNAVLGSLPSYTQLGMASLLPHTTLTFEERSEIVYADGISTQGTPNRAKILQKQNAGSIAITAEDFLGMNARLEGREFIKPYNVIYIYSSYIDKTGDDKTPGDKVFEATEDEFIHLMRIIKHISNMNGSNMIITADHGYLYQHNRAGTDFAGFSPTGQIYHSGSRFILGKELMPDPSVQKWRGEALGFDDDTEALIAKSINRIGIQGAGSRLLYGGAGLQEVFVPVLEINKARKSDLERVEIDIISASSNITGNAFAVHFYQKQPVADKMQPRQVKAGFYTATGQLISGVETLLFNSTDSDAMAREKRQSFLFTAEASKHNGQDVYLKLDEQIEGTNQFRNYKSITYRMLIAFGSEFDDF